MNRREFLKAAGFLAGAALVPKSVWKDVLRDWDVEPLFESNVALGIYDAEDNLLAIGAANFEPAKFGKSIMKHFSAVAIKTGEASYAILANKIGEILRLTCGPAASSLWSDMIFNTTSICDGDNIEIPFLEISESKE